MASLRASRIDVPPAVFDRETFDAATTDASYASAFGVPAADARSLTPEQWARNTFEGGPAALRWFLRLGWTRGLGLRLGRRPSPAQVLGWPVAAADTDSITLAAHSPLLDAYNIVLVMDTQVVWVTFVRHRRWSGRLLWAVAAPVHHQVIPSLLGRAHRHGRPNAPSG